MPLELHAGATDFEAGFRTLLGQKREASVEVTAAVAAILEQVRAPGRRRAGRLFAPLRLG